MNLICFIFALTQHSNSMNKDWCSILFLQKFFFSAQKKELHII